MEGKKVFFTVIYRGPNDKAGSPEFESFLKDLENLYTKIKYENPYDMFFTGDFNAHLQNWWPDGNTDNEGIAIDNLLSTLDPFCKHEITYCNINFNMPPVPSYEKSLALQPC